MIENQKINFYLVKFKCHLRVRSGFAPCLRCSPILTSFLPVCMITNKIILSTISAGALLATALPIGFAQTAACIDLRGQDRAHCEQLKLHKEKNVSASGSINSNICITLTNKERAVCEKMRLHTNAHVSSSGSSASHNNNTRTSLHAFMTKKKSDHKAWHIEHRGSATFTTDHKAWHKASNAAHKALILSIKAQLKNSKSGSTVRIGL